MLCWAVDIEQYNHSPFVERAHHGDVISADSPLHYLIADY